MSSMMMRCTILAFVLVACSHYEPLPSDQITKITAQGRTLPTQLKKRVLVLPTLNKTPHGGKALSEHTQSLITDALLENPELALIRISDMLDTQNFVAASGLEYNWKAIFDRARAAGAIGLVGSALEDVWFREDGDEVGLLRSKHRTTGVRIHLELFDAQSEQLIHQTTQAGELTEEMLRLYTSEHEPLSFDPDNAKNASAKALSSPLRELNTYLARLGWSGRIVKIDFQRFYINAGEVSGLSKGQLLKVFGEGTPIFDPDTQAFIGNAPGSFKGFLRVISFFGRDGAVAVVHSGSNFKEHDRIESFGETKQ